MRHGDLRDYIDGLVITKVAQAPVLLLPQEMKELLRFKIAEVVSYGGHVNNGETGDPTWPRSALGVDSAGRTATAEEERGQQKVVNPDIAHVQPQTDGASFVAKTSSRSKLADIKNLLAQAAKHRPPPVPVSALRGATPSTVMKPMVTKHGPFTPQGMAARAKNEAILAGAEDHGLARLAKMSSADLGVLLRSLRKR
jgi:hypothetical protein